MEKNITLTLALVLSFVGFVSSYGQIVTYNFSGTADDFNSLGSSGAEVSGTFEVFSNQVRVSITNESPLVAGNGANQNAITGFGFVDPYAPNDFWSENIVFGTNPNNNDWTWADSSNIYTGNLQVVAGNSDNGINNGIMIGETGTFVIDYSGTDSLAALISAFESNTVPVDGIDGSSGNFEKF